VLSLSPSLHGQFLIRYAYWRANDVYLPKMPGAESGIHSTPAEVSVSYRRGVLRLSME
jgi:hypothetical protein